MKTKCVITLVLLLPLCVQANGELFDKNALTDQMSVNAQIDLQALQQQLPNFSPAIAGPDGKSFIMPHKPPSLRFICGTVARTITWYTHPSYSKIHYTLEFQRDIEIWTPIDGTLEKRTDWRFVKPDTN